MNLAIILGRFEVIALAVSAIALVAALRQGKREHEARTIGRIHGSVLRRKPAPFDWEEAA